MGGFQPPFPPAPTTPLTPPVTIVLVHDTGGLPSDRITSNPALSGGGDASAFVILTEGTRSLGTTPASGTGAWTFTPTLSDGTHTIVASETDSNGTGNATLTFTLDTTAPAVTETLTIDTGSSNSDNLTNDPALSGTGDPNAVVTVFEGASEIGSLTANGSGVWTFTPTLADGIHTLVAHETDAAGNTGTTTITFALDTIAPVVTETLTIDTGSSNSDNLTNDPALSGTGDPNAVVTVFEGASEIGSLTANGSGVWTFTPTLADGIHTLVAHETDAAGNTGTTTITFALDTTAPAVTETLLHDNGSSNSDNITNNQALTGTGDANTMVTLTEGTTVVGSTTSDGTGVWNFTPTLSDGAHTIVAHEVDTAGNMGSTTFTFTLDTVVPVVTAALLDDTGSSNSDGITSNATLTGTGKPNSTITFDEGTSGTIGTTTVDNNGAWTFTPTLPDGSHTVYAYDVDNAGNGNDSFVSFILDTATPATLPGLALVTGSDSGVPGDGITNVTTPTLIGTGVTGDTVTLYDGDVAIGTATVVNGGWSVTPSVALSAGSHSLTARQANTAGNLSAASVVMPLVIDTTLPAAPSGVALAVGSDSGTAGDGITSATSPVIGGTGMAGDIVKVYDGTTLLGSTTIAEGGAWSLTAGPLANAVHSLTTTQTSAADNVSAASAPLALTVDTVAPAVTAALAANPHNTASTTYNQVLDGGGDPNASVTIREGSVVVGTATADASGAWSFDLAGLAVGAHSLIASETDAAGNTGASTPVTLTVAPAVVPDTRFTLATASTATSGKFFGSDYTGPLPGLQAEYGYTGTANVNVIANVANTFIYSGTAGEDAMVANSGSNVLDSRGGSDWMIGASGADGGTDTFFVDSRASGSPTTWDTALNFHLGDKLTIWDFSPAAGSMSFIDNLGQPGYLGTTLLANLGNGATDLVTFAGLSGGSAQFATSTGASGGLGYLALTRVA